MTKKISVLQRSRVHNQPSDLARTKELALYHRLSTFLLSLSRKKKFPYAREHAYACYRAAATLDDMESQFLLGKALLEEAKFREQLQREGVFGSERNLVILQQMYGEALAYLLTASTLGHVLAKRTYGLCYINGWGVPVDQKKGFQLVVDSIGQENKWDKVPQIFASIGLNKPEFFAALAQHRSHNQ